MKSPACLLVLAIAAGCAPTTGADSFDDTACHPYGGTASGVTFTDAQASAVIDMLEHATADELREVPGVGPSMANALIARRPYGTKKPLATLDIVSGVGPKLLAALRDNVDEVWCSRADGRQSCCGKPSAPSVVINEFSPGSKGWVELYNGGEAPVDLSGWLVDDVRPGGSSAMTIAPGTVIAPRGFVIVKVGSINVASSDQVTLVDANGKVVDQTSNFYSGASLSGKCLSRSTDGGAWTTSPVACTPGASNGGSAAPACTATGGTYDGATFTAAEECHAVDFLNQARFSEMGAIPDVPRHIAYDCKLLPTASDPHAITCGYRTSSWTSLADFSGVSGIGATALAGLKSAAAGWQKNGLGYDTVASTFQNRAALADQPVSLDAVYVTKQLPDETGANTFYCVEVRDAPDAKNYMAACVQWINADSAPPCSSLECAKNMVGKWLRLRGTVRHSSVQPGGYKINLAKSIPTAADPRFLPNASSGLDCPAIVAQAGEECGGLGYAESDCLFAYLTSHGADACGPEMQDQLTDDT